MGERRYTYSFAELCDRLNIITMKIVFSENEEMRKAFVEERDNIVHDIDLFIKEGVVIDGKMIAGICALQLVNTTIWNNESAGRGDGTEKNYELSHGLNSNRAEVKKLISQRANGKVDYKLNYGLGVWDLRL